MTNERLVQQKCKPVVNERLPNYLLLYIYWVHVMHLEVSFIRLYKEYINTGTGLQRR